MEFIKKHPSSLRYLSILGIVILLVPTFFIGYYCGDAGEYFALAIFSLIAIVGSYEVLKNLSVSKPMALLVALTTIIIFFFPSNTFDIDRLKLQGSNNHLPSAIDFAINWKALVIIAVSPIVLLADQNMWKQKNKIWIELIIAAVTLILTSVFVKFIWIVSVVDCIQIFYFLPIAIIADSFGYFGGKYLGKYILNGKKLAPKLSPKKTWAGFIVGYIFSSLFVGIVGWAMGIYNNVPNSTIVLIFMAILLPIISPLGDLLFSGIKRFLKIKDFSNLMPGHGGIMDRIDAMSSVIFFLFLVFSFAIT